MSTPESALLPLVADIVSAHVSNNAIQPDSLPALIRSVHSELSSAGIEAPAEEVRQPAVPIRKSAFPHFIVCLEDGKKLKMPKRHLKTSFSLTPDEYRTKWGLPYDNPMVAPSYASRRSALARSIGHGRKPGPLSPRGEPAVKQVPANTRGKRLPRKETA